MEGLLIAIIAVLALITLWALVRALRASQDLGVHRATYKWTDTDVEAARRHSVNQSHAVVTGKVQEYLAPLLPEFVGRFNPRDARFLGTPVDFVVFDGLDEGQQVNNVVFVEVKTGKSRLSAREKLVREAVQAGRVSYLEMRLPGRVEEIGPIPANGTRPADDHRVLP